VANRTNEIMRRLTVMATIFIPLTFIAGVYGMNFDVMPELRWRFGYAVAWGVMLVIAVALLIWFRRLGWLGADAAGDGTDDASDSDRS
jgi:magnesium transporter